MDADACGGEDFVEHRGELRIPIADEEPEPLHPVPQFDHQVPDLLRNPRPGRVLGDTEDVHPAGTELHDDQAIQALEQHRVAVKEVARQDPRSLSTQELTPGRSHASRCGVDAGLLQDQPHRGGPDPVAQSREFPGDPPISPQRILPGQTKYQGPDGDADGRPTMAAALEGPPPPYEIGVPAQQRARRHEQPPTTGSGQQPRQRADHRPIRPRRPRPCHLPTQHRELMTQDEDLRVFRPLRTTQQHHPTRGSDRATATPWTAIMPARTGTPNPRSAPTAEFRAPTGSHPRATLASGEQGRDRTLAATSTVRPSGADRRVSWVEGGHTRRGDTGRWLGVNRR